MKKNTVEWSKVCDFLMGFGSVVVLSWIISNTFPNGLKGSSPAIQMGFSIGVLAMIYKIFKMVMFAVENTILRKD